MMTTVHRFLCVCLSLLICLPIARSEKLAQFTKGNYVKDKWTITQKININPYPFYTLSECAMECSKSTQLCSRFEFYQEIFGTPGQCTLHTSGMNCLDDGSLNMAYHHCYKLQFKKHEDNNCECPVGYYGNGVQCCSNVIEDCSDGINQPALQNKGDMVSFIKPPSYSGEPFEVLCHFGYGGLTYIQTRRDLGEMIYFNRTWEEYKHGFGNVDSSYWLGLDKVQSILASHTDFQLDVSYANADNTFCQLYASQFKMGDENNNYTIRFPEYPGHTTNGWCNSLSIDNAPFSTYDHDATTTYNCPMRMRSGWWFSNDDRCERGNINAPYNSTTRTFRVNNANTAFNLYRASLQLKRI